MMETGEKIVLWNPHASRADAKRELQQRIIDCDEAVLYELNEEHNLEEIFQNHQWPLHLIIGGGDGTVHRVLNEVFRLNKTGTVSIIPLGTGNDFINSLRSGMRPEQHWEAIEAGRLVSRKVDAGHVVLNEKEERYFFNTIAGGISADYSKHVTEDQKKTLGSLTYLKGSLEVITTNRQFDVGVRIDQGEWEEMLIANFFAANSSRCGGGLQVAPGAKVDDGFLHFVTYRAMNRLDRVLLVTDYLAGRYEENEAVKARKCKRIELVSQEVLNVSIDGEVMEGHHFEISVVPLFLYMLIPEPPPEPAAGQSMVTSTLFGLL